MNRIKNADCGDLPEAVKAGHSPGAGHPQVGQPIAAHVQRT